MTTRNLSLLSSFLFTFFLLIPLKALAGGAGEEGNKLLEQARAAKERGVDELQKARSGGASESSHARAALTQLNKAKDLYDKYIERFGEDPKVSKEVSEVLSLLYWCRKMTPLREESLISSVPELDDEEETPSASSTAAPSDGSAGGGWEAPAMAPAADRSEEARRLYEEAEEFAANAPWARMQIVARYFRIADEFSGTSWAQLAFEKCREYASGAPAAEGSSDGGSLSAPSEDGFSEAVLVRINLRHSDPNVRIAAVATLVKTAGREAIGDLHELFCHETDPSVRQAVFDHLVNFSDKKTLKALEAMSTIRDFAVASDVIRLAGKIGGEKEVRYMICAVLYNEGRLLSSHNVRIGIGLSSYVTTVKSAYEKALRKLLVETITAMGEKGVKGVESLFRTRGAATREAILVLGVMNHAKSAGKIIIYMARGRRGTYRGEAMASLKMMGDEAIPYLIAALSNSSQKMWCAWLLRDMTGLSYGASPAKWWAWWKLNKR